jgi:hypothetical protein
MELNVFVALSPCKELSFRHWTFWRNNYLILLPQTVSTAEHLSLNLNSRIYFLDSDLSFFEIYKYQPKDLKYTIRPIGDFTSPELPNRTQFIWERRSNLSTIHLNINYINNPPYTIIKNSSERVGGFLGEIFNALKDNLGFHCTFNDEELNVWGYIQDNGSYSGIIGQVQMGKANWSIADTYITSQRSLTLDFSFPTVNKPQKIITRGVIEVFDAKVYLIVFSDYFWITILCSTVILIFFIYFMLRFDSVDDTYQSNRLAAAFSFTMLSLVCKESHVLNASWSGKILILSVLFWGFLISVSYNAILTSVLASSRTSPPITCLEDMLNSPDHTLVFRRGTAVRQLFRFASNNTTGKTTLMQNLECTGTTLTMTSCTPLNKANMPP